MTLLQKVKRNLIIDFDTDDEDISRCISAAIAYAEYSLASGDKAWGKKALELFKRIRKFRNMFFHFFAIKGLPLS